MSQRKDILKKAARHWSSVSQRKQPPLPQRNRWWLHETIVRHINERVCGKPLLGLSAGFHQKLKNLAPDGGFSHGISIGCGNASKEFNLLIQGIVEKFDLYELSDVRVSQGEQRAKELGISDRVNFFCEDGFGKANRNKYDLFYWNNSLHHMLDVEDAIHKSKQMLIEGGMFAMDDFVGPSRFQWSEVNMKYVNRVRKILSDRFYDLQSGGKIESKVEIPTIERMIALDPTEAADSGNILPSLNKHFPDAEIILTGGCIYHSALNDVLVNFNDDDLILLESLLVLDDALIDKKESHYCVAFATK